METNILNGRLAIFRINYKSDFIVTLESDAGWMTPFCIKFWTGAPNQAYFVGWDGTTWTHCAPVSGEPTKLRVQFDDHHLPIGELKYQIAYHFTVDDFPNDTEDEVLNQETVVINNNGRNEKVLLDFNGETAPEIQFSLPAFANEAQRIANEQQRIANEQTRISNEETRIANEQTRISNEETRQQNEAQRIQQEQARVNEYATLKADAVAATGAANDAATLANQKAQLAADKAALAQAAANLANAKAQLAADKAALAASAAQLANDKAALAQQKAEYAQTQGGYAKDQGDYAKDKGDICAADHLIAVEDHGIAAADHTQAGNDHTRAESDHGIAVDDHTQAGNDHTRAESDHTRAESDHAAVEVYVDSLGAFDISAYNATGGVLAEYADLAAALGTNGANIPDTLRKGGMSVRFVQSYDNNYVQHRYMSSSTSVADFTNVANWQGVDREPVAGSSNLVTSGGVWDGYFIEDNSISVNLSQYEEVEAAINEANNDWVRDMSAYRGKFIYIKGKNKCIVTANSNNPSAAALLKDITGNKAQYATGTGFMSLQSNETKECFIPEDANYLWVYTYHSGNDYTPSVSLLEMGDSRCCYTKDSYFDFALEDKQNNVLLALKDGQVRTKKFNSANVENLSEDKSDDFDFSVKDNDENYILAIQDGDVKTKGFDSKKAPESKEGNSDFSIVDKNGNNILSVDDGHIHTKNFHSNAKSIQKDSDTVGDTFVIAAYDSDTKSKNSADIVCDGVNDASLIENCINSVSGMCGTIFFCAGTYNMTFTERDTNQYVAIFLQANKKQINLCAQHSNGATHEQVVFKVNEQTYNDLQSDGVEYSIFRHKECNLYTHLSKNLHSHLRLQGICFELYDNQKPITCVNCRYTGQIYMDECIGTITCRPYVGDGTLTIVPSINCVFFRGLPGSCHAFSEIIRCFCTGFGIGWGIQGEHIYMRDSAAVNCLYGFAFNYFPKDYGMYVHPMMLVNCLEECGMNFPIFGDNPQKQSILIYNWHIEHKKAMFDMQGGGHYATETTPGQWYGHIDYNIQYFPVSTRWNENADPTIPFWAEGCGHSMESVNIVQKKIVTTAERVSYAPNYGQTVFDTDLSKICICTNPDAKTWVDANGTEVNNQ